MTRRLVFLAHPVAGRWVASIALASWCVAAAASPQDDFEAGKALGQQRVTDTVKDLKSGASKTLVPNYTDTPPQSDYYRKGDLISPAASVRAQCQANPSDPTCAGVVTGSATRPARTVTTADPALAGAGAAKDPSQVLGNIAKTYSACTVGTSKLLRAATYERTVCSVDTGAWASNACDKTLTVFTKDKYSCEQSTWFAQLSGSLHLAGTVTVAAYCDWGRKDGRVSFRIGAGAQSQEVTLAVDSPIPAVGQLPPAIAEFDGAYGLDSYSVKVYVDGPACDRDGRCHLNFHFHEGYQHCSWVNGDGDAFCDPPVPPAIFDHRFNCPDGGVPGNEMIFPECVDQGGDNGPICTETRGDGAVCWAPGGVTLARRLGGSEVSPYHQAGSSSTTTEYFVVPSGPTRTLVEAMDKPHIDHIAGDYWENTCAPFEAKTIALAPDGVNPDPPIALPALSLLSSAQCVRLDSACVEGEATRDIEGVPVYRACWKWRARYDCTTLGQPSSCAEPRLRACSQYGGMSCRQFDGKGHCLSADAQFDCKTADAVYEQPMECEGQSYCYGGSCYDKSYSQDLDFAKAITMLEAQRESGRYLDPASMKIFQGTDNRCDRELWGLKNCCKGGGTNAFAAFNTLSVASSAVGMVGKAAFSSYTYDALFTSEAPSWVISGFEGLFGTGLDSGLAGVLAGNLGVGDFLTSLVPGPWFLAMLAIQLSGLLDCSTTSQTTAMKRDARLCHDMGDYCSDRDIFGGCITRTQTFCCYPSRLARIINEQGRPQLARGWGTPKTPICDGFTIAELQALDFSRMDLTEFYAEVVPTQADLGGIQAEAIKKQMACYYGGGSCAQ